MLNSQAGDDARLYRRVAVCAVVLAVSLITLGGYVRISGSGMGCGDHWPLCNGRLLPHLSDPREVIEWSHRWVASLLSMTVIGLAVIAWWRHRGNAFLRNPATLAAALLVLQVLLGALTVKLGTAAPATVIHLTNAMVLLAVLVVCVLRAAPHSAGAAGMAEDPALGAWHSGRLPLAAAVVGFVVIVFGAFVANYDAGVYCLGFPLCGGQWAPPATGLGKLQYVHRFLAFAFLGLSLAVFITGQRLPKPRYLGYRRAAHAVLGLTLLQIGVAASMILQLLPAPLRALHLLLGSLVWVAVVVLVVRRKTVGTVKTVKTVKAAGTVGASGIGSVPSVSTVQRRSSLADFVALTKPRIISLLLLTTILPMFITGQGMPSWSLLLWVTVGGYLMAGGANTINMWFDRDIDTVMSRTKLRPIPSGRISPLTALLFGVTQGVAAFWIFWRLVNPLSAWFALAGLLFYVFIYTVWLKRASPQNIVIGGAAGAFPPVVGWTAMTGSLDLPAIYLFAIIFFWTPPHFWALALMKRQDYAQAGIPMMPVVAGERWTKIQMLAYSLMLIPLTLMPSVVGALGLFYGAAALLLGGRLLWYAIKLVREPTLTPTAWRMYKYSLLYLALLFVAMGVDRAVPFGHRFERAPILILNQPENDALGPAAAHDSH